MGGLKRLLECNGAEESGDGKRIKSEADVQMHCIDSGRATAERVIGIQICSNKNMVEMQQDSDDGSIP